MNTLTVLRPSGAAPSTFQPGRGLLLQRKCACGGAAGVSGESEACAKKKRLQARLAIGASNDPLEREADRIADQVLAAQAHGAVNGSPPRIQRDAGQAAGETGMAPASVDRALADPGRPLEAALRQDMERRFGHDFSQVRVHTGAGADQSARVINAHAYTVGQRIVFGDGKYAPTTHAGRRLIAHELTHVVQQSGAAPVHPGHGASGKSPTPVADKVQRFSDVDHHVIEEAALKALFSEEQLKAIEIGNMRRDYSQLPAAANALLLGQKTRFGGYAKHEHFDNFVFDRAADRWVSQDEYDKIWDDQTGKWVKRRIPVAGKRGKPRTTAPQYIEAQLLAAVQKDMPDAAAFEHLGNAFHTIEDFFAHSNFVELTQGDRSHGEELATHASHVHGPGSEASILSTVSDQTSAEFLGERFSKEQATASPLSHGRLAKDFHGNPNHLLAITLAALVIRQVALAVKDVFPLKTRAQREKVVRETIVVTLARYFRPPSEKDKWWETLLSEDQGVMRRKIQALQSATPVTVNQSPASPLRNFEATRFSPMKAVGLGTSLSFSLGDRKFVTIGTMLNLPGAGDARLHRALQLPSDVMKKDEKPSLIWGVQIGGSFDETKWFEK